MPTFDSGNNFVWIGGPGEGFGVVVGLDDEAVNGGLQINEGVEDAPVETPLGEFSEEVFNGIGPRAGCGREVKGEAFMAIQPSSNLGMFMSGIVVENDMDITTHRDLGVDGIEKANELLMAVTLHVASDDRSVKHVQDGEERRGSVAFVIVGHRSETPLLHGQARLGAVKRLNLALLIDGQDDGVRGRINVEPNDIPKFIDEVGVVREFELPIAMGL